MTAQDQALAAALDYIPRWIAHQMRITEQPGCSFAVARHGKLVAEFALGQSGDGRALTPRQNEQRANLGHRPGRHRCVQIGIYRCTTSAAATAATAAAVAVVRAAETATVAGTVPATAAAAAAMATAGAEAPTEAADAAALQVAAWLARSMVRH